MHKAQLIVALDFPEPEPALTLARALKGTVSWLKIGLELYLRAGPKLIEQLKTEGFQIFVDLKFMDIPNTVQAATAQLTRQGADMLTIHTLGGARMAEAALKGREQNTSQCRPNILGVTLLTSLTATELPWLTCKEKEAAVPLQDLVLKLATSAKSWGLQGVVCSGQEVATIRKNIPRPFFLLTPGIRLPGSAQDDQRRVCTPQKVIQAGSSFFVVGRPITQADDPLATARKYCAAQFAMANTATI